MQICCRVFPVTSGPSFDIREPDSPVMTQLTYVFQDHRI